MLRPPFMGRHLLFGNGGALAPNPTIRQHADTATAAANDATFGMACLANSLIVTRLVRSKSLTDPAMQPGSGYTKLAGVHATGSAGDPGASGTAAMFAKEAAGGETVISRDATGGLTWMCCYEIVGARLADIAVDSGSDLGSAALSDIGSIASARGLGFNCHIVACQEAGVHTFSGVSSGDYTEVHDQPASITSGQPDIPTLWMGNADGSGASLLSAVTFSGALPIINTAGIAILVRGARF